MTTKMVQTMSAVAMAAAVSLLVATPSFAKTTHKHAPATQEQDASAATTPVNQPGIGSGQQAGSCWIPEYGGQQDLSGHWGACSESGSRPGR
jgi:hypothetical protein